MVLAIAACQPPGVGTVKKQTTRAKSPAAAVASTAPARRNAAPIAAPSSDSSAAPASALQLLQPGEANVTLSGTLRLDPAYAVSRGLGRIISSNGAGVLTPQNSPLIASNGAGLLSDSGGNIISDGGGNLLSDGGSSILGDAGGTMVSKIRYRVLESNANDGLFPAAGLVLAVTNLRDGRPVPLGVNGKGEPVFHILTNAQGRYDVFVPEALQSNVRLELHYPDGAGAGAKDDIRLKYEHVGAAHASEIRIDEDTAPAHRYISRTFATKFEIFLTSDVTEAVNGLPGLQPVARQAIAHLIEEFQAKAKAVGLERTAKADVTRLSAQMADVVLSHLDLAGVQLTKAGEPAYMGPDEPAVPALVDIMRRLREGTRDVLARDPAFFGQLDAVRDANVRARERGEVGRDGHEPIEIVAPPDLGQLVISEILRAPKVAAGREELFRSVNAYSDPQTGINQLLRLNAAFACVALAIGQTLLVNKDGAKDEALAVLDGYKP